MLCGDVDVVELPGTLATAWCGKLLADVGANVLKLEPLAGDRYRASPGLFSACNTGKSSRILDLGETDAVDAAIAAADVVLTPHDADVTALAQRHPHVVVTEVSPFGHHGSRSGWDSDDRVQLAMSLWMHVTGRPEREPLASGGHLAELVPGLCAASATLMALRARRLTGRGQHVDISQQECLLLCQPYLDLGCAYTGVDRGRTGMPFPMTIVPAADGYLGVNVLTQSQWEMLCVFAERSELLADPRLATPSDRMAHAAELTDVFAEWAATRGRADTFAAAQEWRIPLGYVPRLDEITQIEQHRARALFTALPVPGAGSALHPAAPFLVDGERLPLRPAPALGDESGSSHRPRRAAASAPAATPPSRGPLTGLRVVDLSMFWSGPLTAELLAQYGAEVVKVESVQRVDGWRGLAGAATIEESQLFNGVNLNKFGVTLDLTSPRGRELLRPLVERADVLVENFSPRVMGNFGLTDEVLHEWNPALVVLSMPAFGLTGPWRDYVGFAPTIEQLAGLPELTGYCNGPPALCGNSPADPCAGLTGLFALLATLHADRPGAHVDLSQLEALTGLLAPELVAQQLHDGTPSRRGNSGPNAPEGCYPCAGEDHWMVIAAADDDAWAALDECAGRRWSADPRFADAAARRANAAALDAEIAAWTRGLPASELATELQRRGVVAAPVLHASQLLADDHLRARGSRRRLARDHVPEVEYCVLPFKFAGTPGLVDRPAPTLGHDNDEILGGWLGCDEGELAMLRAERVIGESIEL